jgi:hypothetical protein
VKTARTGDAQDLLQLGINVTTPVRMQDMIIEQFKLWCTNTKYIIHARSLSISALPETAI